MADWALPAEAVEFLAKRLRRTDTVVELGSGEGSERIASRCRRLYSVEHDPEWLGRFPFATTYIHAPLVRCMDCDWYDPQVLARELPADYDCLVIDGPPGSTAGGRMGALRNLHLFLDVPILVDDVHRNAEFELAIAIAQERDKNISVHYTRDRRGFATIGWPV